MAKLLESRIRSDPNFEVPAERHLGLVVFCLKVCSILCQIVYAVYVYAVNYKNVNLKCFNSFLALQRL